MSYVYEVSAASNFGSLAASSGAVSGAWTVDVTLDDNTTYWWRARATDGTALSADMSAASFFVNMANDLPGAPGISAPSNAGTVTSLSLALSVTNSTDLDNDTLTYDFHVSLASNYTTTVQSATGVTAGEGTTSWTTAALTENTTYYWRSRAVDSHGASGNWVTGSFFVNTSNDAPAVPVLSAPSTGSEAASTTPLLSVAASSDPEGDAISYSFELDTVNTFDSANKQTTTTASTSWTPAALSDNTTWYWRSKAGDGTADSAWMATASFFVNTANDAPSVPTVNYPADASTVTVTTPQLSVNAAIDPDNDELTYEYEVYSGADRTGLVAVTDGIGPSWKTSTVLADNTSYYWRARARDEHGSAGEWTALLSFFVNNSGYNDPPALSVLSPGASDAVAYATSYTVRWSDSDPDSDAAITLGYDTLGSGCTGTTIAGGISENDPANSQAFDVTGLAYGTSYWVYAVIDDGTTPVCSYAGSALVRVDPSTLALTVAKAGTGSGTVTADDAAKISCGIDCSEVYEPGTVVTLTASPATGSSFTGWSGACGGSGSCQVTMSEARSVTATFALNSYTVAAVTDANGGLDAATPSPATVAHNGTASFTFNANAGYHVASIEGTCPGLGYANTSNAVASYIYTTGGVTGDCTVFGLFAPNQYVLTAGRTGTGSGTVASSPSGITCGSTCSGVYGYGTVVTLTATPNGTSSFIGWSGACTGSGSCQVTMSEARSVTAQFQSSLAAASDLLVGTDLPSPQVKGTPVLFTAEGMGGTGSYEYEFQLKSETDPTWTTVQSYSSASAWTWNTTDITAGAYTILVFVRSQGSAAQFDTARTVSYSVVQSAPATLKSFTASLASPQQRGAVVVFTADGSGGTGTYEYKFQRKFGTSTTWSTLQNFSSGPTFTWDTAEATLGTYTMRVMVRNQASAASYEAIGSINYSVVQSSPVTAATLTSDVASPRQAGQAVTFTAQGQGGPGCTSTSSCGAIPQAPSGQWSRITGRAASGSGTRPARRWGPTGSGSMCETTARPLSTRLPPS